MRDVDFMAAYEGVMKQIKEGAFLTVYKNAIDPTRLTREYDQIYPEKDYHTLLFRRDSSVLRGLIRKGVRGNDGKNY
jgi:hypothetical protein